MPNLVSVCDDVVTPSSQRTTPAASNERSIPLRKPLFNEKVEFPTLEELDLCGLPNMNQIWSTSPPVLSGSSFKLLVKLIVEYCGSLPSLFTPSMVKYLDHLREVSIVGCSRMEEVISKDGDDKHEEIEEEFARDMINNIEKSAMFPMLISLTLAHLPTLKRFCHVDHELKLPLLKYINVYDSPQMDDFLSGFLAPPNLNRVSESGRWRNEWLLWKDSIMSDDTSMKREKKTMTQKKIVEG